METKDIFYLSALVIIIYIILRNSKRIDNLNNALNPVNSTEQALNTTKEILF